jgi:hypothetical protein
VRDIVIFGEKSDNEMVVVVAATRVVARRSSHTGSRMGRIVEYISFPVENDLYEVEGRVVEGERGKRFAR